MRVLLPQGLPPQAAPMPVPSQTCQLPLQQTPLSRLCDSAARSPSKAAGGVAPTAHEARPTICCTAGWLHCSACVRRSRHRLASGPGGAAVVGGWVGGWAGELEAARDRNQKRQTSGRQQQRGGSRTCVQYRAAQRLWGGCAEPARLLAGHRPGQLRLPAVYPLLLLVGQPVQGGFCQGRLRGRGGRAGGSRIHEAGPSAAASWRAHPRRVASCTL